MSSLWTEPSFWTLVALVGSLLLGLGVFINASHREAADAKPRPSVRPVL